MYKHRVWRDQDGAHFFHEHYNIEELSQTGDDRPWNDSISII